MNGAGQVGDESRGDFEQAGINDGRNEFKAMFIEQAQHKVLLMLPSGISTNLHHPMQCNFLSQQSCANVIICYIKS